VDSDGVSRYRLCAGGPFFASAERRADGADIARLKARLAAQEAALAAPRLVGSKEWRDYGGAR